MQMNRPKYIHFSVLFFSIWLSSCVLPESTHIVPDYYLLSPIIEDTNFTDVDLNKSFYIREVEIPEFLKDSRMALKPNSHSIEFRETERWGEPLSDGIARVVALNLSRSLETPFFSIFPNRRERELVWDVSLSFSSFVVVESKYAEVSTIWEISNSINKKVQRGSSTIHWDLDSNNSHSIIEEVGGLNQSLHKLASQFSSLIEGELKQTGKQN